MKTVRFATIILVALSLTLSLCFMASAVTFFQVKGTVTQDGTPVGEGYPVLIKNQTRTGLEATVKTDADGKYIKSWFNTSGLSLEDGDTIAVTVEGVTETATYEDGTNQYTIDVGGLAGDVSGDERVTAYDSALLFQHLRGIITLSSEQIERGDVDEEVGISASDAKLILKKVVGLIDEFSSLKSERKLNINDNSSLIELEKGQILTINLNANPSNGYTWEIIMCDEHILRLIGEEFQSDSEAIGAPGIKFFRFKVINAGQMTLKLVYHRPWEENVPPLQTFTLKLIIH